MFTGRAARLGAAGALVVVTVVLVLLFGRSTPPPVVGVIFVTQPWPRGTVGELAILDVPESLAPLLVTPDAMGDSVAALDIPANTFITPGMLRAPGADLGDASGLSRLRLAAGLDLWPSPGPAPGDEAVVGPAGTACGLAVAELLDVDAGSITIAATPEAAGRLITTGDLAIWPPAGGAWPPCPEPETRTPILETPPGTARLRLVAGLDLWPPPGPAPGDEAVVGPVGTACALAVTTVLDVDPGGGITIAATPRAADRLITRGNIEVWPSAAVTWPRCDPPIPEGTAPLRLLVDPTHWPPPGPAAGDLAVIGPLGSGCAWMVTELLGADGPSISLAATPDEAARLMAEPALATWPATVEGTWPHCDTAPGEAAGDAVAMGARECTDAGRTWNRDTRECEG